MNVQSALPFKRYEKNIYSQNGEDGVIEEIFKRLGIVASDAWCVEFGAWDGIHLSNTFNLVTKGCHAVYIEGDKNRFQDLLITASKHNKIIPIEAFVSHCSSSENSLDSLLSKTEIPRDFDLLSIDIDSHDLDIWDTFVNYNPKVVVIEINSLVPPGILWRHTKTTPGNTFSATLNVAAFKGYTLLCHTGNLIFVRDDLKSKVHLEDRFSIYPELLFDYERWLVKNGVLPQRSFLGKFLPVGIAAQIKNWIKF